MDDFDMIIKKELLKEINVPKSFDNKILYALQNQSKVKRIKLIHIIRKIIATVIAMIFSTGVAFACYTIYENVWKEPIEYNSYEEKLYNERKKLETSTTAMNNILETDDILEKANEFLELFGYDSDELSISLKTSYSATSDLYYEIKSSNNYFSGIELNFDAKNGNLIYFIDRDIDSNYNIKTDSISIEEAINIGSCIYSKLKLNDNYNLKNIDEISTSMNSNTRKEWYLKYCINYDDILNEYQRLEIRFYKYNQNIKISQIAIYDDGYVYDNNELVITKEKALEIAKEKDRIISELNIRDIDILLDIKPINEFVYLQEKSLGKDDGIVSESSSNGNSLIYSKYSNEKILRKVWNIKFEYEFNHTESEPIHNWKEQFGRKYYIDATTGEIIGGNWGDSLLD